RMRPAHEAMQSAKACHQLWTRTQQHVIRVRKHDLGADGLQIIRRNGLYGGMGADRHEYWRRDRAMRSQHYSSARLALAVTCEDSKGQRLDRREGGRDGPLRM